MEQPSERPSTARFGRFFRLLVGDPNATEQDDVIDLTEGMPDLARIEMRLRRLERGMGAVADALKRSHAQTAASIDRVHASAAARPQVASAAEPEEGDEVHTSALWSWSERGVADP